MLFNSKFNIFFSPETKTDLISLLEFLKLFSGFFPEISTPTLAEPRKHTILPRNHDNFSEASYFFSEEFYTLWSFSPRIGGTYHFRSSFFHTFVFNLWKNQAEYSISVVKYQIFLLFIKNLPWNPDPRFL